MAKKKTENKGAQVAAFIWLDNETKEKRFSSYCAVSEIDLNQLEKDGLITEISIHENEDKAKEKQFDLAKEFNIDYQFN